MSTTMGSLRGPRRLFALAPQFTSHSCVHPNTGDGSSWSQHCGHPQSWSWRWDSFGDALVGRPDPACGPCSSVSYTEIRTHTRTCKNGSPGEGEHQRMHVCICLYGQVGRVCWAQGSQASWCWLSLQLLLRRVDR